MAFSTIAIDGPGASGKSVVGQIIAQRLAYRFIDTGAMYRALTWQGIAEGLSFEEAEEIIEVAKRSSLEIEPITAEAPRGKVTGKRAGDQRAVAYAGGRLQSLPVGAHPRGA